MHDINKDILRNKINFGDIVLREFPPHKLRIIENKPINGLDTETLKGYSKLLADSTGDFLLDGDINDILYYLTKRKFENAYNFFFNLNYDTNAILKFLDKSQLVELKEENETYHNQYKIVYIPKKLLAISRGKHSYNYYDVAQFFNGSLNKNAKTYLDLDKYQNSYKEIDGAVLGNSLEFWENNIPMIIEYCINDCVLTKKLGELLHKTVKKAIGINPKTYMSKASLSKTYSKKIIKLPITQLLPNGVLNYSFNAYSGGRFEIIEKGNVGICSLFDIKSAYPYYIRNLIDINKGKWKFVKSLNENADLGYYLVKVSVKYNKISPISTYAKDYTLVYPIMDCFKYMTKNELLSYEKFIDYEVIDGWEFYAEEYIYPFRNFIDTLFELKNKTDKKDFKYSLYKILMNGEYGLFYEKIKQNDGTYKAGELFNPIYATEITANTKIQIFQKALEDINNVVGFATDSVLFKGKPDLKTGNNLGDWEMEKCGETLVLKSGMYKIGDKIQSRGMKKTENLKTPNGEFKNIIDYITKMPMLTSYPVTLNNPLSFRKVIQMHKKYSMDDINIFTPEIYNIDINKDIKRIWDSEFLGGFELLEKSINSSPLILA